MSANEATFEGGNEGFADGAEEGAVEVEETKELCRGRFLLLFLR